MSDDPYAPPKSKVEPERPLFWRELPTKTHIYHTRIRESVTKRDSILLKSTLGGGFTLNVIEAACDFVNKPENQVQINSAKDLAVVTVGAVGVIGAIALGAYIQQNEFKKDEFDWSERTNRANIKKRLIEKQFEHGVDYKQVSIDRKFNSAHAASWLFSFIGFALSAAQPLGELVTREHKGEYAASSVLGFVCLGLGLASHLLANNICKNGIAPEKPAVYR